jgi:hypothetical protein
MDLKKIEIGLRSDIYNKLETIAKGARMSPSKLISVLLEAFCENDGKVYTGRWTEGPGIRLLPDWPRFSSGVIKIKEEDLI